MANPTETERNGKHDAHAAQARIRELEAENERLRATLAEMAKQRSVDLALLHSYTIDQLPKTEEELLRIAREGTSFKEMLNELFTKHDAEQRS